MFPRRCALTAAHSRWSSRCSTGACASGSAVTVGDTTLASRSIGTGPAVVVCGGLGSGDRSPLGRRPLIVGRVTDADLRLDDPTVSCRHASIETSSGRWVVRDLSSHNGTLIDGQPIRDEPDEASVGLYPSNAIHVGAATVRLDLNPRDRSPSRPRRRHRRPVDVRSPSPTQRTTRQTGRSALPAEPARLAGHTAFSWAMFLAPLAVGLVLALVFNPLMGALALLSPVVMVASWFENRRREPTLPSVRTATRRSIEHSGRSSPTSIVAASRPASTCWPPTRIPPRSFAAHWTPVPGCGNGDPRAPTRSRFGWVSATLPWELPIEQPHGVAPHADLVDALAGHGTLVDAPVVVALGDIRVVGIAGPSAAVAAVVRSMVLQAAVLHGPADLAITSLEYDEVDASGWMVWLPHWTDTPRVRPGRHLIVVVGGDRPLAPGSPARRLLDDFGDDITVVVLGQHGDARCRRRARWWSEITDIHGRARLTATRGNATSRTRSGSTEYRARWQRRRLGRSPGYATPKWTTPATCQSSCRLVDLLGIDVPEGPRHLRSGIGGRPTIEPSPCSASASTLWSSSISSATDPMCSSAAPPAPARASCSAPWWRAWLRTARPRTSTFVLVDFKGGSAFDACADLPHTVGVVTDLDGRGRRARPAQPSGRGSAPRASPARRRREQTGRRTATSTSRTEHWTRSPASWSSSTSSPPWPASCPMSWPGWSMSPSEDGRWACTWCSRPNVPLAS